MAWKSGDNVNISVITAICNCAAKLGDRLEVVSRQTHANPRYHAPISAFNVLTSVPMVLTRHSMKTSPWSASPLKRWIAFYEPGWMCW